MENYQNQQKAPYVIYADFESIIENLPDDPTNRTAKMAKISKHVACGFAYMVVRSDGKSWSKKYRQRKDGNAPVAEEFFKAVQAEEVAIRKELENQATIVMAPRDVKAFNEATKCWICEKSLIIPEYLDAVDVWCLNTGVYEGQAHKLCRWKHSPCEKVCEMENGEPVFNYMKVQGPHNKKEQVATPQEDCLYCKKP